jgi:hypothetical protein
MTPGVKGSLALVANPRDCILLPLFVEFGGSNENGGFEAAAVGETVGLEGLAEG